MRPSTRTYDKRWGGGNPKGNSVVFNTAYIRSDTSVCFIEWLAPFSSCSGVPGLRLVILNRTVTELIQPYVFLFQQRMNNTKTFDCLNNAYKPAQHPALTSHSVGAPWEVRITAGLRENDMSQDTCVWVSISSVCVCVCVADSGCLRVQWWKSSMSPQESLGVRGGGMSMQKVVIHLLWQEGAWPHFVHWKRHPRGPFIVFSPLDGWTTIGAS